MTTTLAPTVSKQAANYREAENPDRACGTCSMFVAASNACTLVRGAIAPEDTCDYWQAQAEATKDFHPEQVRDERGRWVPGGGAGVAYQPRPADQPRAGQPAGGYFEQLSALGQGEPTLTPYDTPAIKGARKLVAITPHTIDIHTPEREGLRQQLAAEQYGAGARLKNRQAWIVLGPPGAGKSNVLARPLAAAHGALVLDSDSSMDRLPEYQGGKFAENVHEEASYITDNLMLTKAVVAGDNIVLPRLGKTAGNVTQLADKLHEAGYQVHAALLDLPPEQAAQRVVARFEHTGRFVDPQYVLTQVGTRPKATYGLLKDHPAVVDYVAYSNAVPRNRPPRLIERGRTAARAAIGRGRGPQLAAGVGRSPPPAQSTAVVLKQQAVLPMTDMKRIGRNHVRVLVEDADGRLLLLHWSKGRYRPIDWAPVQGRVGDEEAPSSTETPWEAAHRELLEETGYGGDALTWRALYPNCWLVQLPPGAGAPTLSAEHNNYRWISAADAQTWLAREEFYGQWAAALGRGRVRKQLEPHHPHLAAALVHGAQLGDWDPLARLIAGPLAEAGGEAAMQATDALGTEDAGAFRVANQVAVDWASHRAAALVRGIQDRTEAGLRDLVTEALGEGWSPQELSDAIQTDWLFSPERADMISRTELAYAHTQGTLATWRATGQVGGKRNILSNLHAIDDECDDATAVGTIPIDTAFPDGSPGPPFHPNCMCVVVPELLDEGDAEKVLRAWLVKYAAEQLRDPHGQFAYEGKGKRYTPRGQFAILTAANPAGQARDSAMNARLNAGLAADLRAKGYHPVEVTGHYTDTETGQTLSEPSFLVSGIDHRTVASLGQKYAQNSIITQQGLHDLKTGAIVPSTGFVESTVAGAYTQLPGGHRLRMGLDWANPYRPYQPQAPRASLSEQDVRSRQLVAESEAALTEEEEAYAYVTGPAVSQHGTAAEALRQLGVTKRHGPRWTLEFEFSPQAWRVIQRHLEPTN